jgi:D-aminoacyl-tRNA deacylase
MKKVGFVFSDKDEASLNIRDVMLEKGFLTTLSDGLLKNSNENPSYSIIAKTFPIDSIFITDLEELSGCDYIVFPSKHQSSAGYDSLSLHTPGNFTSSAELGGSPSSLSYSWVEFQKLAYLNLLKNSGKHRVTPECTHHGPSIDIPCCYIEIGSSHENWIDKEMGSIIANTIFETLDQVFSSSFSYEVVVGIGGPHYCPHFEKLYRSMEYALSHVCAKYALSNLSLELVWSALKSSSIPARKLVLDWKGLGPYKDRIRAIKKELIKEGISVERLSKLSITQINP